MQERPKIICLTPVKNEAWILERFLKLASLWADHIIIADQMSTDGSREIARKFDKVILVDNNSVEFNEPERQKLLISEARKISGPRLLITLDADECFTPNFKTSPEWETMLNSKLGTRIMFQLIDLHPDFKRMRNETYYAWGYMDDGSEHTGRKIHSSRIPENEKNFILVLNSIKVLHFADVNIERNLRKYNWYQCYERTTFTKKSSVDISRIYNRIYDYYNYIPINENYLNDFIALGIDISSIEVEPVYWWDKEVLNYFDQYGVNYFIRENIWKTDWCKIAKLLGREDVEKYKTPRNKIYKKIRTLLQLTQKYKKRKIIKFMDWSLKTFLRY
jgi:hypothetical protein